MQFLFHLFSSNLNKVPNFLSLHLPPLPHPPPPRNLYNYRRQKFQSKTTGTWVLGQSYVPEIDISGLNFPRLSLPEFGRPGLGASALSVLKLIFAAWIKCPRISFPRIKCHRIKCPRILAGLSFEWTLLGSFSLIKWLFSGLSRI